MKTLFLAILTAALCSCAQPVEHSTADAIRYYSAMGDSMAMAPASKRVEQSNPKKGSTPSLSPASTTSGTSASRVKPALMGD